jgi:hypothetical protein
MDYIGSILWYISWPVLIFVSYRLVLFALKKTNLLNQKSE